MTDPFYAASTPFTNPNGTNLGYYQADRPVTALACTDRTYISELNLPSLQCNGVARHHSTPETCLQLSPLPQVSSADSEICVEHQYCNPTNKQCTPLTSFTLAGQAIAENKIGLKQDQFVTALQLVPITAFLSTYSSVHSRGANALRASETVNELLQIQLPNTQWMTEVNTWFAVSMAKLQQKVIEYATGPGSIPDGMVLSRPLPAQEKLCKNQIVRSFNGTISFSVLGVAIILIVASLLLSISLILPLLVGALRHVFKWKKHKGLQWTLDSTLQMQRLAYEEAGQGYWTGGASSVPVTRENDLLGMPEGVDAKHPRLGRAWRHSDNGSAANGPMESESLMGDKAARYKVEPVAAHQGYS